MKLLAIYHSGVGNTRLIAEMLSNKLRKSYEIDIYAIEEIEDTFSYEDYDGYIIGFPTYHAHPSVSILKLVSNINKLHDSKPAYIFTTCGWFSANALRIFTKVCVAKNIIPVLFQSYRCAATDGVLLAPKIKMLYSYEKGLIKKIEYDVEKITSTFNNKPKVNKPRFKIISIINYPNKKLGQLITFKIYLHKDNCTKCGKCIKNCNMKAMRTGQGNYPIFDKHKCEKCYRCIHHCPNKALSLSKRKSLQKQLTRDFFDSCKRD